jgi:hypothetical protein
MGHTVVQVVAPVVEPRKGRSQVMPVLGLAAAGQVRFTGTTVAQVLPAT